MGRHVDDILFLCKRGYEQFVQRIQEAFQVEDSKVSEGDFVEERVHKMKMGAAR